MSFDPKFICCPGSKRRVREGGKWVLRHFPCNEVVNIRRLGSVGEKNHRDSKRFYCEACGSYFTSDGETWKEAHGAIR